MGVFDEGKVANMRARVEMSRLPTYSVRTLGFCEPEC